MRTLLVVPLAVPPSVDELRRRVESRHRRRRRRRLELAGVAVALVLVIAGRLATAGRHRPTTAVITGPAAALPPSKLAIFAAAPVDPKTGWLLTDQGLYHSNDGGHTWADVSQPPEMKTFNGARFVAGWEFLDADHAWLGGLGGGLEYTADGGHSWRSARLPGDASVDGVVQDLHFSFVNPSTGFASVEMAHQSGVRGSTGVFETTDGGTSWRLVNPAAPFDFKGEITFTSPTTGWAVGSVNGLYRTTDGGRSWIAQQPGRTSDRTASYGRPRFFGPDGVMEARLNDATGTTVVYATHDGGRRWSRRSPPRGLDVSSYGPGIAPFQPVSAAHWVLAAGQRLFVTDDGGASWTERHVPLRVSGLSFFDGSTGWAWATTSGCSNPPSCPRGSALLGTFDAGRSWAPISLPVALIYYHDAGANISMLYPAARYLAPAVDTPGGTTPQRRELVSIATYPLRPGGDPCDQLPVNALDDLGPTDVFLSVSEAVGNGGATVTGISARPRHFGPSQGSVPSGGDQCLNKPGRFTSRLIAFRDPGGSGPHGRVFYAFVAIGSAASAQIQAETWNALDSFNASA
jgi:photosystem II stability/assembly factor-like uncharacterized protein